MNIQILEIKQNSLSKKWYADISVTHKDNIYRVELKFHEEPTLEYASEVASTKFTEICKNIEEASLIEFARNGNDPRLFEFEVLGPIDGLTRLLNYIVKLPSSECLPFLAFAKEYTVEGLVEQLGINSEVATYIINLIQSLVTISDSINTTDLVRKQIMESLNG